MIGADQGRVEREAQRTRIAREKFENLLLGLPIGVVVVDRRYDIQAINSAARRLFGIHSAAIGEDFLHLTRSIPPAPLRMSIDAAFRGETPVTGEELAATEMATGEMRFLELACYPQKVGDGPEPVDAALVTVTDVTEKVQQRRALEETVAHQRAETERLEILTKRLAEANRQLLDANQDLSSSNMDVRSANEEFLVANEEAQAATEEIETLNEELQATNEELETLNEELQATVEELNTTNDDLQARTAELQEAAVSLDLQRQTSETEAKRLEAILGGIGDAVLVVDRSGATTLANARYSEFFGGPQAPSSRRARTASPCRRRRRRSSARHAANPSRCSSRSLRRTARAAGSRRTVSRSPARRSVAACSSSVTSRSGACAACRTSSSPSPATNCAPRSPA